MILKEDINLGRRRRKIDMNTTAAKKDASAADDKALETLRQQLRAMVTNKDWAGITRLIKEEEEGRQNTNTTMATTASCKWLISLYHFHW